MNTVGDRSLLMLSQRFEPLDLDGDTDWAIVPVHDPVLGWQSVTYQLKNTRELARAL